MKNVKIKEGDLLRARERNSARFPPNALYIVDEIYGTEDMPYARIRSLVLKLDDHIIWADKLNTFRTRNEPDFDIFT